ncbi:hypothetical protein FRC02_005816 [Tulasnella sp. 418]|nr:hypothetical protein FRC02_005816 [Tulasnella sp. 418]
MVTFSSSQSSSDSPSTQKDLSTWDTLKQQREIVKTFGEIVVPASREASPSSEQRVAIIRSALKKSQARNKRGVGDLLFLACSRLRGKYTGASRWGPQPLFKVEPSQRELFPFATDEEERIATEKWEEERKRLSFKPRPPPGSGFRNDIGLRKRKPQIDPVDGNTNPSAPGPSSSASEVTKASGASPSKRQKTSGVTQDASVQVKTPTKVSVIKDKKPKEIDVFVDSASNFTTTTPSLDTSKGKGKAESVNDKAISKVFSSLNAQNANPKLLESPLIQEPSSSKEQDSLARDAVAVALTMEVTGPASSDVEELIIVEPPKEARTPRRGAFNPELSEEFVPPSFTGHVITSTPISVPRRPKAKPLPIPIQPPSPHLSTPPSSPTTDNRVFRHTQTDPVTPGAAGGLTSSPGNPIDRSRTFPLFGIAVDDIETPPDLFSQPVGFIYDSGNPPTTPKKDRQQDDEPLLSSQQRVAAGLEKLPTLDELLTESAKKRARKKVKPKSQASQSHGKESTPSPTGAPISSLHEVVPSQQGIASEGVEAAPLPQTADPKVLVLSPRLARLSLPSPSPSDEHEPVPLKSIQPVMLQPMETTAPAAPAGEDQFHGMEVVEEVVEENRVSPALHELSVTPFLVDNDPALAIDTGSVQPSEDIPLDVQDNKGSTSAQPSIPSDLYNSQFDLEGNVDAISGFLAEEISL